MTVALMIDVSSNNPVPNLQQHWDAGYRVLALKATESTSYTWTLGNTLADKWHSFGGRVVRYAFVRPGNPEAEADFYVAAIRASLRAGDVYAIDAEVDGIDGPFVRRFIARVNARGPRYGILHRPLHGLVYGPPYFLRDHGITGYGWGLWLADYEARPSFIPPGWKTWTAWQFSQTASAPGTQGSVDESHIRGFLLPVVHRNPVLHMGDRGIAVRRLQDLLNKRGAHLRVDGVFGRATRDAVNWFRSAHGWARTGRVGPGMWRALTRRGR